MQRNWYALYTKSKQEFLALEQLSSSGIECFLPTHIEIHQWSDRKKKIEAPLFQSYIFINANEKERLIALKNSSIIRIITFLNKPSIIPDWEIQNLKMLLKNSQDVIVTDLLEIGKKIKILSGPLQDLECFVVNKNRERWIYVSVELLKRSVSVKLPIDNVVRIIDE